MSCSKYGMEGHKEHTCSKCYYHGHPVLIESCLSCYNRNDGVKCNFVDGDIKMNEIYIKMKFVNKIINKINERIKVLSDKNKHYLVDMGSIEESKEEKVYHKAGKGRRWCVACEKIKELEKLKKEIKSME